MSDLPPSWVLVLVIVAEVAIGVAIVAVPGFAYGWVAL